jgi:hypothetical protein
MNCKISALKSALLVSVVLTGAAATAHAAPLTFTTGDLVIDTVSGTTLDQASAITLKEFSLGAGGTSASLAGSLILPQTASGANAAISGEYGSASEGFLQLSGDGKYLTLVGYGVNAAAFNSAPLSTYGATALGQTTSLTGGAYTTVPRVIGLINGSGYVDATTALTGVFNTNNPRSAYTADGKTFYVSGQGASKTDTTQGLFYTTLGSHTATAVDTSTDTRFVTEYSGSLYVSRDYNPPGSGKQNFTNVSKLSGPGGALPTSSTGLVTTLVAPSTASVKGGNTGSIDLTTALENGVNNSRVGKFVYLSPEEFFFADSKTLYIADSGQPKNGSANAAALGEGGLQKWSLVGGAWVLDYDLVAGLNLVNNALANSSTPTAPGVTGLFGLTGKVVNGKVELFATSYGLNELSQSYLYEITDTLSYTTITQASSETFTTLYTAATGESIRGVSFAPSVPETSTWAMMLLGFLGLGFLGQRKTRAA